MVGTADMSTEPAPRDRSRARCVYHSKFLHSVHVVSCGSVPVRCESMGRDLVMPATSRSEIVAMFQIVVETIHIPHLADVHPLAPLRIADAVFLPELDLAWSERVLRAAIERGDLSAERVGRSIFVTRQGIEEWRSRCRLSPAERSSRPAIRRDDTKASASRAAARSALESLRGKR